MSILFLLNLFLGVSSGADKNEGYTYVEDKRCIADRDLHKLVATTVTCSFTNHNNHLDLNPLSPTLLLNSKSFRVCMYDCVHDILLLSQPIDLFKVVKSGRKILAPSACLLLWIVVNHRYVVLCVTSLALQVGGAHSFPLAVITAAQYTPIHILAFLCMH